MRNFMRRKAFTLVELMVAMGLLVIIMAMAGVIFKTALKAHRLAVANADVLDKFRLISQQLDRDFRGLRKEGEIFVAWIWDEDDPDQRQDRIGFWSIGDFRSFGDDVEVPKGRLARISYSLNPDSRVLARSQHIYRHGSPHWLETARGTTVAEAKVADWSAWQNEPSGQHDPNTIQDWLLIEREAKLRALWGIYDVNIVAKNVEEDEKPLDHGYGTQADPTQPNRLHSVLCEAVGQFRIEWWQEDADNPGEYDWQGREFPGYDKSSLDEDEMIWAAPVRWLWYPYRDLDRDDEVYQGEHHLYYDDDFADANLVPEQFDQIPGLGRALRFTVTLYDDRGLLEEGREFTHIVQLD